MSSLIPPQTSGARVRLMVVGVVLCASFAHASLRDLKQANRHFVKGHYEEALKAYNDELVDQPHSSILHYNAGAALYQMGKFTEAAHEFKEAAQSAIPLLKAAAHYNRGNALYKEGQWDDAIEAYKESLRVNPQDEDAKYNLGVALQTKQNPPAGKPSGGQGKPKGSGDKKSEGQTGGQGDQQKNEMSREDAERLLSAAGSGEQRKGARKMGKGDVPHPDEDW